MVAYISHSLLFVRIYSPDLVLPLVTPKDMTKALSVTHPSTSAAAADKFVRYAAQFGSGVTTDLDDEDDDDADADGDIHGGRHSNQASSAAKQAPRGGNASQQRASTHRGAASASSSASSSQHGPASGLNHDAMLDMYEQPSALRAHASAQGRAAQSGAGGGTDRR